MQIRFPRPAGARKRSQLDRSAAIDSTEHPEARHGFVKSFDGTQLFYSVEGKGKPLVFCYGLVCSSLHWTYQISRFQRDYQAVWFDYRGHHNSEIPTDLTTINLPNIARDLGAVLDELKIKDAVFLGHSMGVNVVLEFYRQQPERVAGMVLANGTASRPLENLFRHNALQTGFQLLQKAYQRSPSAVRALWRLQRKNPLARTLVALGGFNPYLTPPEDIQLYVDQVVAMDPAILLHLIQNYDSYDCTPWLHTIKTPTLIIAGDEDKVTPLEQQELLHQLIPDSRLEVVHHGSHCPQMDLPELVDLKIEKFLAEINYAPEATPPKESASPTSAKHPRRGPAASA